MKKMRRVLAFLISVPLGGPGVVMVTIGNLLVRLASRIVFALSADPIGELRPMDRIAMKRERDRKARVRGLYGR